MIASAAAVNIGLVMWSATFFVLVPPQTNDNWPQDDAIWLFHFTCAERLSTVDII